MPPGAPAADMHAKLPRHNSDTPHQPPRFFPCHLNSVRVRTGWASHHDMEKLPSRRIAARSRSLTPAGVEYTRHHTAPQPLHTNGVSPTALSILAINDLPPAIQLLISQIETIDFRHMNIAAGAAA